MSALTTFAEAAAKQLDAAIEMTEAVLMLARPAKAPVDVGTTVRRVQALLGPVAKADERRLEIDGSLEALGTTTADGTAVRLAIGASMLAAIDASARVRCLARNGVLRLEVDGGTVPLPGGDVIGAAREAGIDIQAESSAISISFPR